MRRRPPGFLSLSFFLSSLRRVPDVAPLAFAACRGARPDPRAAALHHARVLDQPEQVPPPLPDDEGAPCFFSQRQWAPLCHAPRGRPRPEPLRARSAPHARPPFPALCARRQVRFDSVETVELTEQATGKVSAHMEDRRGHVWYFAREVRRATRRRRLRRRAAASTAAAATAPTAVLSGVPPSALRRYLRKCQCDR